MAADWLHENYGVDIRCYRLQLSQEEGSEYLTCTCIYPPIEIATLTRHSGTATNREADAWPDWDAALKAVENQAVIGFFRAELSRHQESRLRTRELIYRIGDKRRFYVPCRKRYAYAWQVGRFEDDEAYWRKALTEPDTVRQVDEGRALRFRLVSEADFAAFKKAVGEDLINAEFSNTADFERPPSEE
jgi:hypothetical protein